VFATNLAGGAIVGGILAAALGGDSRTIAAGILLGGLTGAAAGYAKNAESRGATARSLASFADRDARRDASKNDELVNTLVRMNACRLDQVDRIAADARAGKINQGTARNLLGEVRSATRQDNRVVNAVAGNNRNYEAYVGVLSDRDVAAATATRRSVSNYTPAVRQVTRTSRGRAAIVPGPRATGSTGAALARNSATRLDAANDVHVRSVEALIGSLDLNTPT